MELNKENEIKIRIYWAKKFFQLVCDSFRYEISVFSKVAAQDKINLEVL